MDKRGVLIPDEWGKSSDRFNDLWLSILRKS